MGMVEYLRQLFEYDRWANHAALASLGNSVSQADKPFKVFSHVIGAQRVWRARFDDPPSGAQPWPVLKREECSAAIEDAYERWMELLGRLIDAELGRDLVYLTTQDVEFRTPVRDVLTHLLMHSAYHRGQVAAAVREAGGKPASTDYVAYLRQRK